MARILLILGGARSGKSRFAQDLARQIAGDDVLFVATAEAGDAEMARRIEIHKKSRPAAWALTEAPCQIGDAVAKAPNDCRVVLVDCLTLLVSNVLLSSNQEAPEIAEARIQAEITELLEASRRRSGTVIIVSGEVGQGLVPVESISRLFRDLLGWANQRLAAEADDSYLLVAGLPIELKSLAVSMEQAARKHIQPDVAGHSPRDKEGKP